MPRLALLIVAVMLVVAAPGPAAAAPPAFSWSLAPTVGIPAERSSGPAERWELEVRLDDPDRFLCLGGDYRWELDGRPVTARRRGFCAYRITLTRLGSRSLRVLAGPPGQARSSATADMDLRELSVVIIGDSVASGDGTPDRRFIAVPRWRDRDCRRSDAAGAAHAVARLEAADPATAIRLINVSCSGAGLRAGVLRPQGPAAPRGQLAAAVAALGGAAPDAVIMIAGANDAGFNAVVRTCLVEEGDCRNLSAAPGRPPLPADIAARVAVLPGRFAAVAGCLAGEACPAGGSPVLSAERVVIAPYFDPTGDDDGRACRFPRFDVSRAITRAEMTWARAAVLAPLNAAVSAAAERHSWRLAPGIPEAFARRGVCADESWVLPPRQSLLRQGDLRGAFHPDTAGHECYSRSIAAALAPVLRSDGLTSPIPGACGE